MTPSRPMRPSATITFPGSPQCPLLLWTKAHFRPEPVSGFSRKRSFIQEYYPLLNVEIHSTISTNAGQVDTATMYVRTLQYASNACRAHFRRSKHFPCWM